MELKKHLQTLFLTIFFISLSGLKTHSQKIYATSTSELSSGNRVDNPNSAGAANGEFATVRSYGGLALGIGAYSGALKLEFPSLIPANTTAYIKVDGENNGLFDSLLGGSLGALLSNAAGAIAIGDHYVEVLALDSSGVRVASGRTDHLNASEILKIARNKNGDVFITITPKVAYSSLVIKDITDALLLGKGNLTNVYHAFYINKTPLVCNPGGTFTSYDGTGITLDLLNIGATGVKNPEFAIDGDDSTYAAVSVGIVSAFASMYQDIQYLSTASEKDQLEINISTQEGSLLNVALLQNIYIDLYKENLVVYSVSLDAANTISILPPTKADIYTILIKPNVQFDRFRLTLSSPVGVSLAQQINLFGTKIAIAPPILDEGGENQTFCTIDVPKVSNLVATASGTLVWYNQAVGGNAYSMSDTLLDGLAYYASNFRGSCESNARLPVSVSLRDPATPSGSSLQSFCTVKKATIASLEASASGTVTWYDRAIGGNVYANEDSLQHEQQYYAGNLDGTCESSLRLKVTVNITDVSAPEGMASQNFCSGNNPTISSLEASASGTIIWYDQEISGNQYSADTPLVNQTRYYASNSDGACESSERLTVLVTIQDPLTPISANSNQRFCATESATIANLAATASGIIIWYNKATEGAALDNNTFLIDGLKYYAANLEGTCESKNRLEVIVSITNPEKPSGNSSQNFCTKNNPNIMDLEATANGTIIWYNQASNGISYDSDTALVDGSKYYAVHSNGSCECTQRLEVLVMLSDADAPTGKASQNFCSGNNPTISSLEASASGTIFWYDQEIDGNKFSADTPLVNQAKYYASNSDGACESSTRFEVNATLTNLDTPTGESTQQFCTYKTPKVEDLKTSATNTVIWYDQETDGNAYNTETPLIDGLKYYAANSDGSCESNKRFTVSVRIEKTSAPTSNCTNQMFCAIDAAKVTDLEAVASGELVWYDQQTNGSAYAPNTPLIDGLHYFGANLDGDCESSDRLAVTVSITDSSAPEGSTSQTFCIKEMPTVLDLEASATGTIIWYNQETGGEAYNSNTFLKDGFSYYAANSVSPCESSLRLEVKVTLENVKELQIQGKTREVCFGTQEIYEIPSGFGPYAWNVAGGRIISGGTSTDNSIAIEWNNLIDTSISASLTGGCFDTNRTEQAVEVMTCSDLTIQENIDILKPSFGDTVTFTIQVANSLLTEFTDIEVFEVLASGFSYKSKSCTLGTYNENNGIWSIPNLGANQSATLKIKAEVRSTGSYLNTVQITKSVPIDIDITNNSAKVLATPLCLKIYNTITPNRDGLNDYFVISCIENFPNTVIEIFDRYGSLIYKKRNYKNDWNGVANQTGKIIKTGEKLPNGTYFFILKMNDKDIKDIKSYIQIIK